MKKHAPKKLYSVTLGYADGMVSFECDELPDFVRDAPFRTVCLNRVVSAEALTKALIERNEKLARGEDDPFILA